MKNSEVEIGKTYDCLPIGCRQNIQAEVLNIYNRIVVVEAIHYSNADRPMIIDKQNRLIVQKEFIFDEVPNVSFA